MPLKVIKLIAFSFTGSFKNVLDYILANTYLIGQPKSIIHFEFPRRNPLLTPLFFLKIIYSCSRSHHTTLLLPRGNSRLILWILKFAKYKSFISYSDGLGDCIYDFIPVNNPKYLGHVGFNEITKNKDLLISAPLEIAIESWSKFVLYSPNSPPLLIIKIPKEIDCSPSFVLNLYDRVIRVISSNSSKLVYISCPTYLSKRFKNEALVNIGNLNKLDKIIYASSVIGLPSTIFLSLDKSFPKDAIRMITLPSKRRYPVINERTQIMANVAAECRKIYIQNNNLSILP